MANKVSLAGKYLSLTNIYAPLIDISGDKIVQRVGGGGGVINEIDFSLCPALVGISLTGVSLATANLLGSESLVDVALGSNALTSLDISGLTKLLSVDLIENALTETAVDSILSALDAYGLSNGYVGLNDGTNAPPSAAGLTSKANLEGKGWTVDVNS